LLSDAEALWLIRASRLPDIGELLAVLAASDGPGHQYLDDANDQLIVMASKDEYGPPSTG
jgi:hypothetical protein